MEAHQLTISAQSESPWVQLELRPAERASHVRLVLAHPVRWHQEHDASVWAHVEVWDPDYYPLVKLGQMIM